MGQAPFVLRSEKDFDFPSDATQEEKDEFLQNLPPVRLGGPPEPSVMDQRNWLDKSVDYLPGALGALGGYAGGTKRTVPGATLAALSQAGGEGLRQTVRAMQGRTDEYPETVSGRVARMAEAGALGGSMELGGRGIIGGLKWLAPRMMRGALGAQTPVRKSFPDVNLEQAALDINAIPGSARSLERVQQEGVEGAARLRNDLRAIDIASGNAPVATYDDAVSVLRGRAPDARMAARGGATEELEAVKAGVRKVTGMRSRPLNAEETFVAKQAHQRAAQAAYRAKAGASAEAGAEVSSDLAQGIVAALRSKHPEIAASLLKQQESMALTRAMENAQPRTSLLRNIIGTAGGAGAAAAMYGATGDALSAIATGVAVPTLTNLVSSPASLARMGITSKYGAQAMQSVGARIPDAVLRKQLQDAINVQMGKVVMINGQPKLVTKVNKDDTFEAVSVNR